MAYSVAKNKDGALSQLNRLVKIFDRDRTSFIAPKYNETQLRVDFINPLLKTFGWDVNNNEGQSQFQRPVIQEESIDVEDDLNKKTPDYTLRVQGIRKLFVEAKKPSIDICTSSNAAFQIRRYGWNSNLAISILTNFDKLAIYDCRYKPDPKDDVRVACFKIYDYKDYIKYFEEIYNIISFESVSSGVLDDKFTIDNRKGQRFDNYFLSQIEKWRVKLAKSAIERNNQLIGEDINFLIQRLLNRIIFLRICEDRNIETYETLKNIDSYDELKSVFIQSDKKYNSNLFNFIDDTISLKIDLDADVLIEIFEELYYPLSPYNFSVVDPSILSQIYEKFLGKRVIIGNDRQPSILEEPEAAASNGVIPTPKMIAKEIVNKTLAPLVASKSVNDLFQLKIADICCGSGTFLISVYDFLLQNITEKLNDEHIKNDERTCRLPDGTIALTLKGKRDILTNNIYGVDVNPYAVEVTYFSLLLKLLEEENACSIDHFLTQYSKKVLPDLSNNIKCGNSLIDDKFYVFRPDAIDDDELLLKVKPFNWYEEFPFLNETKGFDAIVGNPPYVRIQNLVQFMPEEIKYYQSTVSEYSVAKKETIDKYYVFIQRAITLLNSSGFLGYIIPHKFFVLKGGKSLRRFIIEHSFMHKIIHFGVAQAFPGRSNYTAILIIQNNMTNTFEFKAIDKITPDLLASDNDFTQYDTTYLSSDPWIFTSKETARVFSKMRGDRTKPLKSFAAIAVGLQTSSDNIYVFEPEMETDNTFVFSKNGNKWEIEKQVSLPCIYKLSFRLFDTIKPNRRIIFPYTIKEGKATVFTETKFKNDFPLCWNYLCDHKEKLKNRSINGSKDPKWYQFGRSQSLTKFHNSSKLIWHVLSKQQTYVYDESNLQFTGGGNGPYYSLISTSEYSVLYLMGILAHPIFECWIKSRASEFRGAYYSHGKQFIEMLPIREINFDSPDEKQQYIDIINAVKRLIQVKKQYNESYGPKKPVYLRKIKLLKYKLFGLINHLYGITNEEVEIVLNDKLLSSKLTNGDE